LLFATSAGDLLDFDQADIRNLHRGLT